MEMETSSEENFTKPKGSCTNESWSHIYPREAPRTFPISNLLLLNIHQLAPKSGISIRSPLNPCGISNYDRYQRELQAVGAKMIAVDHTFEVLQNYAKSNKMSQAKACFTMNNERGEVVTLAITRNTSV